MAKVKWHHFCCIRHVTERYENLVTSMTMKMSKRCQMSNKCIKDVKMPKSCQTVKKMSKNQMPGVWRRFTHIDVNFESH